MNTAILVADLAQLLVGALLMAQALIETSVVKAILGGAILIAASMRRPR